MFYSFKRIGLTACLFLLAKGNALCRKDNPALNSNYSEISATLKNNASAVDTLITGQMVNSKEIFDWTNKRPVSFWVDTGYLRESFPSCRSNGGLLVFGLDFSQNNFLLKRNCAMGIWASLARNGIDYKSASARDDELNFSDGHLKSWLLGYHCDFSIWGFDVSTVTSVGGAKSRTFSDQSITFGGKTFSDLSHNCFLSHSKIDVGYLFDHDNIKFGPNVGIRIDKIKQKPEAGFDVDTLKYTTVDGIAGLKIEHDHVSYDTFVFLGVEHSFKQKWSEPWGFSMVNIGDEKVEMSWDDIDRTKFLVTFGFNYPISEKLFFNFNYSGRYNSGNKSSSLSFGLNKIF